MKRTNRIRNMLINNLSSLVRFTGLLVSIGVLTILCSCGQKEVYYVSDEVKVSESDSDNVADGDMQNGEAGELNAAGANESSGNGVAGDSINAAGTADIKEGTISLESKPEGTMMVVHLCGAVNNPGVYELASDSRVIDAVIKAGGFSDEACEDALNLAMSISDGTKIYVPTVEEIGESDTGVMSENLQYIQGGTAVNLVTSGDYNGNSDTGGGRININTASKDKLMTLTGIGSSRADAIIAYREEHGAFKSIEDIMNVSGIKSGSYEKIKDDITVN